MKTLKSIALFGAAALVLNGSAVNAQQLVFGAAQNGDFTNNGVAFGEGIPITTDAPLTNASGLRRAANSGTYFASNWVVSVSNGFGGIDQIASNGNPGLLINNNVSLVTGTAFANEGSIDLGGDGVLGGGDDTTTQPSGAFNFPVTAASPGGSVPAGSTFSFAFDAVDNTANNSFRWEVALLLDGESNIDNRFTISSGEVTGVTAGGVIPVTGSGLLTGSGTSFNPVFLLENIDPGPDNDQAQIDNLTLTYEDTILVGVIGDVQIDGASDGMVLIEDFHEIAENFGNTGAGKIDGDATGALDGIVDLADFVTWKNNFGAGSTSLAVPEPSAAVLLMGSLLAGLAVRGKVRS